MKNKLTPEQMATVYWIFRRGRAVQEVQAIMNHFKESATTVAYWGRVLVCLQARLSANGVRNLVAPLQKFLGTSK